VTNKPYLIYTNATTPVVMNTRTQAEYNAFLIALRSDFRYATAQTTAAANPVAYFTDGLFDNTGTLKTDGIDFSAAYAWDMDWASAHVGVGGTYTLNFQVTPVSTAPLIDRLNQFGSNLQFRARLEAGLEQDGMAATVYVNYQNSYKADPSFLPPTAAVQYRTIDSYTTFDLSLSYNTGDEIGVPLLRHLLLSAVVTNVTDADPPFFLIAGASNPVLFDPNNASAIGRMVTLRVTKNW
jgi:iron complex outermembrane receptor protein